MSLSDSESGVLHREPFAGLHARTCALRWESKGQRSVSARPPGQSRGSVCVCLLADNKHTEAAARPVAPRWEERTEWRAGPAGRGLLLLPRHLICSVVGDLPFPFLPTALRHRDSLRTNRCGDTLWPPCPTDTDGLRTARLRVCLYPFLTALTQRARFEPACQDKPTSPIYAPASPCTRDRNVSAAAAHRTGSGLSRPSPAAHSPLLRAGNGDF